MNFNKIFDEPPKTMKKETTTLQPTENDPRFEEIMTYKLNMRYAEALRTLDGQVLLDEIFDISNEYRKAGMLKEANNMLKKAEEIERSAPFQNKTNKNLNQISGENADLVRELTRNDSADSA